MRILAFDVGGTVVKSAIFDGAGNITPLESMPSGFRKRGIEPVVEEIADLARSRSDFDAVGVAMAGLIDTRTKRLLFEHPTDGGIGEYPLGDILREATGKPVFVLNDANAAALGEARAGAGVGRPDFLCLTYGTGVGGAIILNGRLLEGARGIAGEVGHMVIHAGGRPCVCGRRGCYELYASTTALVNMARKADPGIRNGREVFEKLPGNPALRRTLRRWVDEICEGLCSLAYIFNPSCIIVGGGVMEQDALVEMVRARVAERLIHSFAGLEILRATLGNAAGLYGAMEYAKDRLAEDRPS